MLATEASGTLQNGRQASDAAGDATPRTPKGSKLQVRRSMLNELQQRLFCS